MAEALYTQMTGLPAVSAATHVNIDNQIISERPLAAPVIRFMQREGIDVSQKQANQVTKEMMENAAVIVVLNRPESIPEYLQDHPKAIYWQLDDPSGKDDAFFEDIIGQIKENLEELVSTSST